ncbi:MAG: hypothetical protein ACM31C_20740 [Acidobacteriota bacterium]
MTWSAAANAGAELAPLADADLFARGELAVYAQWRGRWIAGGVLGLARAPSWTSELPSGATIHSYLIELAGRLHPSARFDLVLGWRAGRAGLDFTFAYVHATALEPVAELVIPVAARIDLRVEPLAIDLYRSSTWQLTLGARAGAGWSW